jgi:hypothetical protein
MTLRYSSIALAALALAACDPTGNTNISSSSANVRLANFLTDGQAVTLSVVGLPIHSGAVFGAPTIYKLVSTDQKEFDLTRTSDGTAIGSDSVDLILGRHYTYYVLGIATAFKGKLATDDTVLAATGNVKIRFLHGVKTQLAHGIDLYVSLPGDDSLNLLTPIVPSLAYGSASAYVPVDTAWTRVRLTLTGQTTTIFDSTFATALADSSVLTFVATDKIGGGAPVRLQVVEDKTP